MPQALQEHSRLIQKILIGFIYFGVLYNFDTLTNALTFSLLTLFLDSLLYLIVVVGITGIVSLIDTGTFWNSINISFLIFFILIPFLNGILDFISLTISRYFSRKILHENLFLVIFHLILDFIFAVVFLFALIGLLYYSIELFNSFVDVKLQIPIGEMLHATKADPFSVENAWITFILLSMLVPTLLHILLALTSMLLYITKTSDWFISEIEKSQKSESKRIKASAVLAFPVTLLSIVLFYIFIYLPINFMLELF